MMERRFYLNASNTKWISIGVKPATKMLAPDAPGFYAEIIMNGQKMSPVCLGGIDGFLTLCQVTRNSNSFKYTYPGTGSDYTQIKHRPQIGITESNFNGRICYAYDTKDGRFYVAIESIMEMLKFERLIIACMKSMQSYAKHAEKTFNELVNRSTDLSTTLAEVEKSSDFLILEIVTSFNELFTMCVESKIQKNAAPPVVAGVLPSTPLPVVSPGNAAQSVEKKPTKRRSTTKKTQSPKKVVLDAAIQNAIALATKQILAAQNMTTTMGEEEKTIPSTSMQSAAVIENSNDPLPENIVVNKDGKKVKIIADEQLPGFSTLKSRTTVDDIIDDVINNDNDEYNDDDIGSVESSQYYE